AQQVYVREQVGFLTEFGVFPVRCPELQVLSRYQDGGLDEKTACQVRQHLMACPACEERFRTLGKLGLFWRVGLGRPKNTPCLTAEEVGTYLAGRTRSEQRERIEAHLAGCESCLHEVALFSDVGFERLSPSSPVPTRRALAEFAKLNRQHSRPPWLRRTASIALRAAAALLLATMILPITSLIRTEPDPGSPLAETGTVGPYGETAGMVTIEAVLLAELPDEGQLLVSQGSSLVRLTRQMRLILQQTLAAASSPTEERVGLLQEDVLNSGLVNSIEELSAEVTDPHILRFLVDSKCVLLKVVRMDKSDASDDLSMLVNELRQMNLIETARLIELRGGGLLCLTASL
ncbi:unnamed protein product, partial [marine sediment metagenome]